MTLCFELEELNEGGPLSFTHKLSAIFSFETKTRPFCIKIKFFRVAFLLFYNFFPYVFPPFQISGS